MCVCVCVCVCVLLSLIKVLFIICDYRQRACVRACVCACVCVLNCSQNEYSYQSGKKTKILLSPICFEKSTRAHKLYWQRSNTEKRFCLSVCLSVCLPVCLVLFCVVVFSCFLVGWFCFSLVWFLLLVLLCVCWWWVDLLVGLFAYLFVEVGFFSFFFFCFEYIRTVLHTYVYITTMKRKQKEERKD